MTFSFLPVEKFTKILSKRLIDLMLLFDKTKSLAGYRDAIYGIPYFEEGQKHKIG
jgi:hypothetical protein